MRRDFCSRKRCAAKARYFRNSELHRFMPKYHEPAELAPRDVVARAIAHELEVCRLKEPVVYLDLTHLKADHIRARFPRIYETCLKYNIDITEEQVPIRPAAHYRWAACVPIFMDEAPCRDCMPRVKLRVPASRREPAGE